MTIDTPSSSFRLTLLHKTLLLSLAVHVVLLTLRWAAPEQFNRVFEDTPLEVIFVNTVSDRAPDKAQALAQVNRQGGGDVEKGRSSSPLPPTVGFADGDALENDNQVVQNLKQREEQLLASVRAELANLPPMDARTGELSAEQKQAQLNKRKLLLQTLGEIEKRVQEQNARPKKRYISPATQQVVYASYYDALRLKIEDYGTRNFPSFEGRNLYGELIMKITVNHNGRVLDTSIVTSSGSVLLDARSEAIVRGLRFDAFQAKLRQEADQIVVVTRFIYAKDQTLSTQLYSQ